MPAGLPLGSPALANMVSNIIAIALVMLLLEKMVKTHAIDLLQVLHSFGIGGVHQVNKITVDKYRSTVGKMPDSSLHSVI